MAKGYKCPNCESHSGKYDNGHFQCTDKGCATAWWGPFDRPYAGEKRKGFKCFHCGKSTSHPVATISKVGIWRCSTCASTVVGRT